jgi:TonB family protein
LDRLVLRIVSADRFNPGLFDGKPVVVAEYLTVGIQTCLTESRSDGDKPFRLQLRSYPVQKPEAFPHPPKEAVLVLNAESWLDPSRVYQAGGEVSRAALLNNPQAELTNAALKANFSGSCRLSMIVDTQGMPQNVQLLQPPIGYGLDEEAVSVVNRYRFTPAMKNDEPVAIKITVIVNFQLR